MKQFKSWKELENALMKECDQYQRTFATTYCSKAADELTKTAETAIEIFYSDYEPTWYERTSPSNLKKSYRRYYRNNGHMVYGGVYIGSEYMDTYYKENGNDLLERDPYLVVATAWEYGLHGIYGWHTEKGNTGFRPLDLIEEKIKDAKFLNNLYETAKNTANANAGEIIKSLLK